LEVFSRHKPEPKTIPDARASETGTLLLRAKIIQCSSKCLSDSATSREAPKSGANEKNFLVCSIPYRPSKLVCDINATVKTNEYACGVANKKPDFDPHAFLATISEGRKFVLFPKKQGIFIQGDTADAVFYIQTGKVRLTVVSNNGKEATLGILGDGEFFGEGALAGQAFRMGSATAMTNCTILRIDKKAMMEALHREHEYSDMFLARNIRYEADLVDPLFDSSEKRLSRIPLLLPHFGKDGVPETVVRKISQETLAEMVGTTRSRVSFFMNRFRKLGFIRYNGGLQLHSSLLNVVLHD
jgi:CRP/FNR family cyclic AMP-dependent transcriptional regulator